MAAYAGHITSPLTGKKELVGLKGFRFEDTPENASRYRRWMRTLFIDNSIGVAGNLLTTVLLALLAFAILHPAGKVPVGWRVAAEQGEFFGALWGPAARIVFLVIAGCFLADSWLAGVDAVSRVHGEMLWTHSTRARGKGLRYWYYFFLAAMVVVTWTMLFLFPKEPDQVLAFTGVLSLFAVAIYSVALWLLNTVHLPKHFPPWTRPGPLQRALLGAVIVFYLAAAVYYAAVRIRMMAGAV
jgi:hypothetical protein